MNKKLAVAISALAAWLLKPSKLTYLATLTVLLPSSMTARLLTGAALTAWHLSRVCASSAPAISMGGMVGTVMEWGFSNRSSTLPSRPKR